MCRTYEFVPTAVLSGCLLDPLIYKINFQFLINSINALRKLSSQIILTEF